MKEKCRVCLLKHQNMVHIFEGQNTQDLEVSLADMISDSTGFPVAKGDLLPEFICVLCLQDMTSTFRARKTYETNQQLVCQIKEEIIEEDFVEDEDYNGQDCESYYEEEDDTFACHVKNEPLEESCCALRPLHSNAAPAPRQCPLDQSPGRRTTSQSNPAETNP